MTIGEKIKRVRMFRKMTQAELGTAVGLGENSQNRIAHYERGTRVPQKELLDRSIIVSTSCFLAGRHCHRLA